MSSYSDQIKLYMQRYKDEVSNDPLVDPHDVAAWAYLNGLHKPSTTTIIDAIASDIAQAWREEYRTDKHGRRYRAKHAVKKRNYDGKTMSLWADMDDVKAPRAHFEQAFGQRRTQAVNDCVQLRIDVDVYNEKRSNERPIPLVLDFTDDVEELLQGYTKKIAA